ncbi:FixH family protein [Lysobacter terrestris]|uniref:FixH family protein n=2 Tax=Agrilutibacter terrestris TaxID=2865112 RepID=A0A7H0G1Q8_9GAMM|nr:FixH family protein [Lysobacter terrestris]
MTLENRVHASEQRPAWREPMVWLVAAIPAAAVIATIALLVVSARSSGNNDAVADRVQRTAQVQVADLGPDATARELRLSAIVRLDTARGASAIEVLPVDGGFARDAPLLLSLHHPAIAGFDRTFVLAPTATGWRSNGGIDLGHDWNVQLAAEDGRWRLQGRWIGGQRATYLRPALGGE